MKNNSNEGNGDGNGGLDALRLRTTDVNMKLLELLNERAKVAREVREFKIRNAMDMFDPGREKEMMDSLTAANAGPFSNDTIQHLFKEIFKASLGLMEKSENADLIVARRPESVDVIVKVKGRELGREPVVIAGPCSVEDREQMEIVAAGLHRLGVGFIRGGAFKPRTSPYSFQGLGEAGLVMLKDVADRHGLATVTEVVDTRTVQLVAEYADILQIGSRNMANYELLKVVACTGKPVLLKRGFAATLEEFLQAAEYLAAAGNENIILCERGIRSFNRETRYTLDISAVPLLRGMCRLPVIVDVSHAAGRRDILSNLARAALAAGAHGVMIEVHPNPGMARSDSSQQIDLDQFERLLGELRPLLAPAIVSAGP
jgi:3-deoxy-7-phosphoheptulonate synthase/chorismate mutase